jgi:hypothetical protein
MSNDDGRVNKDPNGLRKGKAENFPTFLSSSSSIVPERILSI